MTGVTQAGSELKRGHPVTSTAKLESTTLNDISTDRRWRTPKTKLQEGTFRIHPLFTILLYVAIHHQEYRSSETTFEVSQQTVEADTLHAGSEFYAMNGFS